MGYVIQTFLNLTDLFGGWGVYLASQLLREVLKSPAAIVSLSASPCSSVIFAFCVLRLYDEEPVNLKRSIFTMVSHLPVGERPVKPPLAGGTPCCRLQDRRQPPRLSVGVCVRGVAFSALLLSIFLYSSITRASYDFVLLCFLLV